MLEQDVMMMTMRLPEFGYTSLLRGRGVRQIAPASRDNEETSGSVTTYIAGLIMSW